MLVHFAVENFRSIRERQTLSMLPSAKDRSLPGNLTGTNDRQFLVSAILFGPNASGKSNVLKGFNLLRSLVESSATAIQPGQQIAVPPFRLDAESRTKPTRFEIAFIDDGVRYIYDVAVSPARVEHEELVAYPNGQPQRWYSRSWTSEGYLWHTSGHFKGSKDLQERTRDNALFLSVGAQFNHPQLSLIYKWFTQRLAFWDMAAQLPGAHEGMHAFTTQLAKSNPKAKEFIARMLVQADLGIQGIQVDTLSGENLPGLETLPKELREQIQNALLAGNVNSVKALHSRLDADGVEAFDMLSEESAGTIRLYNLLGPLWQVIESGACVAIDEIDASMHPLLVRAVLGLLHDPLVNVNGSQAIVTSHDVSLLNQSILRRDQIWMTEKNTQSATTLVPLTDYGPKQKDSIQRGYLAGRYGGIPVLPTHLGR